MLKGSLKVGVPHVGRPRVGWPGFTYGGSGVDLLAPGTPTLVDLASGSDTGTSSSDDITSSTTPDIIIDFVTALATNDIVEVRDIGAVIASHAVTALEAGGDNITLGLTLLEGVHVLQVRHIRNGHNSRTSPSLTITVDTTAPIISTVSTVNNAENSVLAIVLVANEAVAWSITGGADQARFEVSGSTLRWAANGTKDFENPNDADTNNTYIVQVTATDIAGNTTNKTITVTVTDVSGATITSVVLTSIPAIGTTYIAGEVVSATTTFSGAVTVTGTPQLTLNVGGSNKTANYTSGSGTTALVFSYTIQSGDLDANGISIGANALALNGGTIGGSGETAVITHSSVADNASHKVDAVAPTVLSLSFTSAAGADNTYTAGDVVTVGVVFSEAVTVVGGTPTITIVCGASNKTASYTSGSGGTTLTFSYTIAGGDTDTDGLAVTANTLALGGGTIRDAAGNNATLTHSAITNNAGHKVDTTAPTVTTFTPLDNATGVSVSNNLTVLFSENVAFNSVVSIVLKKGSDNSTIQTFTQADIGGAISISSATLTINPTSDLTASTDYYIQIGATSILDLAGNAYAGISNTTTWNWTTGASGPTFALDFVAGPSTTSAGNVTYTAVSLGAADTNRIVAVCVGWRPAATGDTVTSITIGGVSATQATGAYISGNFGAQPVNSDLWYAAVPTGTTGDIVINFSASPSRNCAGVYRIVTAHPAPSSVVTAAQAGSTTPISTTITVPGTGGGFAMQSNRRGTNSSSTWTNAVKDFEVLNLGGFSDFTAAKITGTGSIAVSSTVFDGGAGAGVVQIAAAWDV